MSLTGLEQELPKVKGLDRAERKHLTEFRIHTGKVKTFSDRPGSNRVKMVRLQRPEKPKRDFKHQRSTNKVPEDACTRLQAEKRFKVQQKSICRPS